MTVRVRNSRSWLMTTVPARRPETKRSRRSRPSRSRSFVGSSRRKTSYRERRREARPARAAWPPERAVMGWSRPTARPRVAATSSARSSRSAPPRSSQRSRLSEYASSAPGVSSTSAWVASSRARWAAATPVRRARKSRTVSPSRRSGSCGRCPTVAVGGESRSSPCSGVSSPASRRSSVDLPAPLTPTRPITSRRDDEVEPEKSEWSPWPAARSLATRVAVIRSQILPSVRSGPTGAGGRAGAGAGAGAGAAVSGSPGLPVRLPSCAPR